MSRLRPDSQLVSVVITTRNEERNIANCLDAIAQQTWRHIETVVIDNNSTDSTKDIARRYTDKVYNKGPERSAQRNYGIMQIATGDFAIFLDADMIASPSLVERCVEAIQEAGVVALHIEEIVLGRGLLARIRRYERAFYSGTVIDGARFFRREDFVEICGFDEDLPPGPEDWDLDKRFKTLGKIKLLPSSGGASNETLNSFIRNRGVEPKDDYVGIYHNEDEQTLRRYLSKKAYYSEGLEKYRQKWGASDVDVRRQLGSTYRLVTVFLERRRWQRILVRPDLAALMFLLRFLVAIRFVGARFRG